MVSAYQILSLNWYTYITVDRKFRQDLFWVEFSAICHRHCVLRPMETKVHNIRRRFIVAICEDTYEPPACDVFVSDSWRRRVVGHHLEKSTQGNPS